MEKEVKEVKEKKEKKIKATKKGISFDELMSRRITQVNIPVNETTIIATDISNLPVPGAVVVWLSPEDIEFMKKKLK